MDNNEELDFAEVHGIVTWIGKRTKIGSLWGSTDFKVKTPKSNFKLYRFSYFVFTTSLNKFKNLRVIF